MPWLLSSLAGAALSAALLACSSNADAPAGGNCASDVVQPTAAEETCQKDSDCATTVPGGDVCHPCQGPEFFTCSAGVINASSKASYEATLAQALGSQPGFDYAAQACGTVVSCPADAGPACVNGQCTLQSP